MKICKIDFQAENGDLAALAAAEIEEKGAVIVQGVNLTAVSESDETLNHTYHNILAQIGTLWNAPYTVNLFTHVRPQSTANQHSTFGALAMAQHTDLPELPDPNLPPVMATVCVAQSTTPAPTTLINLKAVWEAISEETQQRLLTERHRFADGHYCVEEPPVKEVNGELVFRITPEVLARPELAEFCAAFNEPVYQTTFTLQEGEILLVTNGIGRVPMTHGRGADPASANFSKNGSKKRHLIRGFLKTVGVPSARLYSAFSTN